MPTSCGCLFSWSAIASLPRGWKTAAPGPLLRAAACHHMPLTLHRQPPAPTNPPPTPSEPPSHTARQAPPPACDPAPTNANLPPKPAGNDVLGAQVRTSVTRTCGQTPRTTAKTGRRFVGGGPGLGPGAVDRDRTSLVWGRGEAASEA